MRLGLKVRILFGGAVAVLLTAVSWTVWHVVVLEIESGVMLSYWWVGLLFLAGLLLPQWIALEVWIFRPLARLKMANVEVLGGNLEAGFVDQGALPDNEVGELIQSHNAMLDELMRNMNDSRRAEEKRQENETRLRTIQDSVQAGILVIDAETHRIIDANPAVCRMVGTSREEIVGQMCHRFVCQAEEGRCPVLDLGQEVDNAERTLLSADGRQVPILKTVNTARLDGRLQLIESFVDITERKRQETQREAVHCLRQEVWRMENTGDIDSVLDAIGDALKVLEIPFLAYSINVPEGDSRAPAARVYIRDPGREIGWLEPERPEARIIAQAWRSGEVAIRVAPEAVAPGRATLRFAVRDTGIGIPADKVGRLFTAFTQVDGSTTRRYGGTGLGLAVSRQLVELMGGEIGVESREGEGSTFHFTAVFEMSSVAEPEPGVPLDLRGLKALIVDDNQANRTVMQRMVESLGLQAEMAASGAAGLEVLRQRGERGEPFDLVLLDWRMPEMDGMEMARRIREDARLAAVRLVMMTAFGRGAEQRQARKTGIDAFLVKPIKQSLLRETLQEVISGGEREKRAPVAGAEDGRPLTGARLLLAEDNPVNQRLAMIVLEQAGCAVDVAGNGQEAVEAVRAREYDAVLMDVQMPEMDGYEATRQIRQGGFALPIIAMTASAMKGDRELCLEAGMDDYVSKPIDRGELFGALRKWIGERREMGDGRMGEWENGRWGPPPDRPAGERGTGDSTTAPMDARLAELPGIDLPEVMKRVGQDEELLRELLAGFVGEFGGVVDEIRRALDVGDGERARRLVHSLKGASGNLSAKGVQAATRDLEAAISAERSEQFEDLLAQLGQALVQVFDAIGELAPLEASGEEREPGGAEDGQRLHVPDRETLVGGIESLRQCLRDQDPVATDNCLEEVGAQLAGTALEERFRRLAGQVGDFDFAGARDTLETIVRQLEIPLD